jgi:hypothetical protein
VNWDMVEIVRRLVSPRPRTRNVDGPDRSGFRSIGWNVD